MNWEGPGRTPFVHSNPAREHGRQPFYNSCWTSIRTTGQNNEWLALNNLQFAWPGQDQPPGQTGPNLDGRRLPERPASYTMGAQAAVASNEYVILNANLNSGSGSGDLFMYIPMATLGTAGADWVYLYSPVRRQGLCGQRRL